MSGSRFSPAHVAQGAGRVAVLMGGHSAEREISLNSGRAVHEALVRSGVDAHALVWNDDLIGALGTCAPARVFNALHGRGGEDGQVQGLLEVMGIPYTGSGVLGSALAMDKVRTKRVWQAMGIPTPGFVAVSRQARDPAGLDEITLPVMVKPACEGSSVGAAKVEERAALLPAIEDALRYDEVALVEQWITGAEYTVGILDGEALPVIRLETPHEFYDFDAKYRANSTRYICPCELPAAREAAFAALALDAFHALGANGWGRIDLMVDAAGAPWLIELNTVPGMTDHSLVPMAAKARGIGFDELVLRILATSMQEASHG